MRFLLRFLLGIVIFVGTLGLIGSGALWAYGEYGITVVEEQISVIENQMETELEEEFPGSEATVDIQEFYYKLEGTTLTVVLKTYASASVADVVVEEKTVYAAIDVIATIKGEEETTETYEEGAEWDAVKDTFNAAPEQLFDKAMAQQTAITFGLISAGVIVGSIIIRVVFLRKKRLV